VNDATTLPRRERPLAHPEKVEHAVIQKAAAAYAKLVEQEVKTQQDAIELDHARARAQTALTQAKADALRGKGDAGVKAATSAATKAEQQVAAKLADAHALHVAVADARDEFVAEVERHRDEFASKLEARLKAGREECRNLTERLAAAITALEQQQSVLGWLHSFPDSKPSVRPARVTTSGSSPNGSSLMATDLLALLTDAVAEPEPPAQAPDPTPLLPVPGMYVPAA